MSRNYPQIYAASGTLLVALAILLWLMFTHLNLTPHPVPEQKLTMVVSDDEEFVEVIEEPVPEQLSPEAEAAPATNPVVENNRATAAPASGQDLSDNGPVGKPNPPVSQQTPSPVKVEKPKEPTREEIAAREEKRLQDEASRRANADVGNAFVDNGGKNNTDNLVNAKPGNAGKPDGKPSQGNGHGVNVNARGVGGWGAPSNTAVAMASVGQIVVTFDIKPDGSIENFTMVSSKTQPPSYTSNTRLLNSLKAEVAAFYRRQAAAGRGEKELRHATLTYIIK